MANDNSAFTSEEGIEDGLLNSNSVDTKLLPGNRREFSGKPSAKSYKKTYAILLSIFVVAGVVGGLGLNCWNFNNGCTKTKYSNLLGAGWNVLTAATVPDQRQQPAMFNEECIKTVRETKYDSYATTQISSNAHEIRKKIATSFGLSGGGSVPYDEITYTATASAGYSNIVSSMYNHAARQIHVSTAASYQTFKRVVDQNCASAKNGAPHFTDDMKKLPTGPYEKLSGTSKAEYIAFIQRYGTHYVKEAAYGGKFEQTSNMFLTTFSNTAISTSDIYFAASFMANVTMDFIDGPGAVINRHFDHRSMDKETVKWLTSNANAQCNVVGGDILQFGLSCQTTSKGAWKKWRESLRDDNKASVLSEKVASILELIPYDNPWLPNMKLAMVDYVNLCPQVNGSVCSNHGRCIASSGGCDCAAGWKGKACDQPVCGLGPFGQICSGHGQCITSTTGFQGCNCDDGFTSAYKQKGQSADKPKMYPCARNCKITPFSSDQLTYDGLRIDYYNDEGGSVKGKGGDRFCKATRIGDMFEYYAVATSSKGEDMNSCPNPIPAGAPCTRYCPQKSIGGVPGVREGYSCSATSGHSTPEGTNVCLNEFWTCKGLTSVTCDPQCQPIMHASLLTNPSQESKNKLVGAPDIDDIAPKLD